MDVTGCLVDGCNNPFFHLTQYSLTDKEEIYRGMASTKRLLAPHVLILQMLSSRFQATRYRRPGLMLLIQRLALISARAHRYMRLVIYLLGFLCLHALFVGNTHPLTREARFTLLLFGLKPSAVRVWMHTARTPCGIFILCRIFMVLCSAVVGFPGSFSGVSLITIDAGGGLMVRTRSKFIPT